MKGDIRIKLENRRNAKLKKTPDIIAEFIHQSQDKYSLKTQLAYLKDFITYLEYIVELPEFSHVENLRDITINDLKLLKKRDIWQYFEYLSSYEKTFLRSDGVKVTKNFTNSPKGKKRKLNALHTLYRWLGEQEYDIEDITRHYTIKVNETREIKDRLDDDELKSFFDVLYKELQGFRESGSKKKGKIGLRNLSMVAILAYSGIRISELVQLDIKDIDLKKKSFIVFRKGGDQEVLYMHPFVHDVLSEYLVYRDSLTPGTNALFISTQDNRIHPRSVRYYLEKYRNKAGISIKITPHVFRRTFGMKFYNTTEDIQLTADQLGNTVEVARKYYVEPTEERKRNSIATFSY